MRESVGPTKWSKPENQEPSTLPRFESDTEYPGNGFSIDETNMVGAEEQPREEQPTSRPGEDIDTNQL